MEENLHLRLWSLHQHHIWHVNIINSEPDVVRHKADESPKGNYQIYIIKLWVFYWIETFFIKTSKVYYLLPNSLVAFTYRQLNFCKLPVQIKLLFNKKWSEQKRVKCNTQLNSLIFYIFIPISFAGKNHSKIIKFHERFPREMSKNMEIYSTEL